MKANRRRAADTALQQLYARVPQLQCQGLCYASCGVIECSERERELVAMASGAHLPTMAEIRAREAGRTWVCPALSVTGRCTAYGDRPMICRLWGAVENLPCPWNCPPAPGQELLSAAEGFALLAESYRVGGPPSTELADISGEQLRTWAHMNPEQAAAVLARGHAADQRRMSGLVRATAEHTAEHTAARREQR